MRSMQSVRPRVWGVIASVMLAGCSSVASVGRGGPGHYAQAMDSATSACMRSPVCYAMTGEDAVLPWLSRAAGAVRTMSAVLRLLDAAELERVETLLIECAKEAHAQVNEQHFGPGRLPSRKECDELVKNPWGQEVKRSMELGRLKHELALECARKKLDGIAPGNYSLESRYGYDLKTKLTRLISREQVEEWLQAGWQHLLLGTLVPDVVIHETGNPLKAQAVYDFKFPCANDLNAQWRMYPSKHPYQFKAQGQMYKEALGGTEPPALVSPVLGITR
jgi:hypothetical protein